MTSVPTDPAHSDLAQVEAVCAAAAASFDDYRRSDPEKRAAFLDAIAEEIVALGDNLIATVSAESRLPPSRLAGERARTVGQLQMFAQMVRKDDWRDVRIEPALPERQPSPRPDVRSQLIPLGPVAVFGASNFPLAFSTAGGDTASALAVGCPVVVKGHPAHPRTSAMVAAAIRTAAVRMGLPDGVLGHLSGPDDALGVALVQNRHIAAVGFTGSRAGGLALTKLAQARPTPIPVFAEMSSVNPVILFPGALRERGSALGAGFVASLTLGSGQFCTNPGFVLALAGEDLDAFVDIAGEALRRHTSEPMLTDAIRAAYVHGSERLAGNPAVESIAVGAVGDRETGAPATLYMTTASSVLADASLADEVFGSTALIVRCDDLTQVEQVLIAIGGQLTATLHFEAEDFTNVQALMPLLERRVGRIVANGWPTGVEVGPAMVHGGPYPATSDGQSTSVGTLAIRRFLRPVCYQGMPVQLLPPALR